MGLKKLLTDLDYRTTISDTLLGSDIDFKTKSISHNDQFNNPPLIGRVSWNLNDRNANPTFVFGKDHNKGGLDGGGFRGGIATNIDRRKIDHERISTFLGDSMFQWPIDPSLNVSLENNTSLSNPLSSVNVDFDMGWQSPFKASSAGEQFKWRQIGLQRMNPKINAPMEGILEFSPANQRTYFPLSTKAAVRFAGVSQIKREGTTLGLFGNGYEDDKDFLKTSNKNRLIYLYNKNLAPIDNELIVKEPGFFEKVGNIASNVMNFIGGKGEMLYDYNGGPNSVFGIGRTFIGRYTNTNPNGITNPYHENFQYSQTQNPFIEKENNISVTKGNIREDIYGEIKLDKNLTNYIASPNHPRLKKSEHIYNIITSKLGSVDSVNALNIFKTQDGSDWEKYISNKNVKDFIPFQFEVIDIDNPLQSTKIVFRAYIDSITDDYSANHNEVKYSGRAEKFYTYNEFDRRINISFKIAALSRLEMEPIYRKLNYLVAQTSPNYKGTRMRTPYMKLTVGDWFNRLPGVLSNVSLNWSKDYPWEIKLDEKSQDAKMLRLPHVLDVSVSFLPIHKMRPENEVKTAFISIDKWLEYGEADFTNLGEYKPEDLEKELKGDIEEITATPSAEFTSMNQQEIKTPGNILISSGKNVELIPDHLLGKTNNTEDLKFTQRWNKFKENLNNEGLLGIDKEDLKNIVK